jgi:hypothetical protein
MSKPQQPELHRSGRGATDPASAKANPEVGTEVGSEGAVGPVPEENLPGHHPEKEQDKPDLG